jgi:hypothetical protein
LATTGAIARHSGKPEHVPKPILEPQQSELQRDQLLSELESLNSSDAADAWAQRALAAKNSLTAVDAQRVEDAFQKKLVVVTAHNAVRRARARSDCPGRLVSTGSTRRTYTTSSLSMPPKRTMLSVAARKN